MENTTLPSKPASGGGAKRPVLLVASGPALGRLIELGEQSKITLGRSAECDVALDDPGLSRRHAEVGRLSRMYFVRDLGSRNGSFVNGERVELATTLSPNDHVRLGGDLRLLFALLEPEESDGWRNLSRAAEAFRSRIAAPAASGAAAGVPPSAAAMRARRAGGMGEVWSGRHVVTHRRVALKFVRPDRAASDSVDRVVREARAACAVEHTNICRVHDVLELPSGAAVLVMDHLEGRTLRAELDVRGKLPLAEAATFFAQVASAIGAAHGAGVLHRDIKPANLFLDKEGRARVLDFGIAKLWPTGETETDSSNPGTPAYMAPDQLLGDKRFDPRVDVAEAAPPVEALAPPLTPHHRQSRFPRFPSSRRAHLVTRRRSSESSWGKGSARGAPLHRVARPRPRRCAAASIARGNASARHAGERRAGERRAGQLARLARAARLGSDGRRRALPGFGRYRWRDRLVRGESSARRRL